MVIINRVKLKADLLKFLGEGLELSRACRCCNVAVSTFNRLCASDAKFKQRAKDIRFGFMSQEVESILCKLSKGVDLVEETETWIEERADGTKVQKTRKVKKLPPNEKAVNMLAKKYAKDFTGSEININHDIGITIRDRALTIAERRAILEADKLEGKIEEVEYKEI